MGIDSHGVDGKHYFCWPGYYTSGGEGEHSHDNVLWFNTLEELGEHRLLHAFDGEHMNGTIDNMTGEG